MAGSQALYGICLEADLSSKHTVYARELIILCGTPIFSDQIHEIKTWFSENFLPDTLHYLTVNEYKCLVYQI